MSQSLDSLFWTSHDNFLRKLQEGKASTSLLNDHFEWLLYGTQKFKPSNEPSRKQIIGNAKLEFKGKPFLYNAKLRPLVLRAAKLLDLDEIQAILLLRRWVKNHDMNEDTLQENDPAAMNTMVLQVLKYYNLERHLLLKSIQVVLINEADGGTLADLRSRLLNANVEEQLHARLRENVESGAIAISRRLRAGDAAAVAGAAGADTAAAGASTAVAAASTGFITTAATLDWLKAAKDEMQTGLIRERIELLNCMLLLYERCRVACKPERALALARLLLDRVFASVQAADGNSGGSGSTISFTTVGYGIRASAGNAAAEADVQHSRMLAALLLMSCLDLPGHILLTAGPAVVSDGAAAATPGADPPLGGKTMDLHNQISQYAAMPETALLLLTWVGCLRLLDLSGSGNSIRDLDASTRDLEGRVAAIGGLAPAAAALKTACDGAFGIVLLQYRGVARKALCVLCTAFDLGADSLNPAMYGTVEELLKLCFQDDVQACTEFWDESVTTMAPLRSLRTSAVRLFPMLLHPLLMLLRLTAVSAATASRAYAFLQEKVSLMVVHTADEPALKHLEDVPNEVLVDVPLPWNLAPTVEGMVLPEEMPGTVICMPPVLSALQGRFIMVEYAADVNGNCPQSRGQVLLLSRAVYCVAALEHALRHNLPLERSLFRDLSDTFSLLGSLCALHPDNLSDIMAQSVTSSGACRDWIQVAAGVLAIGPQLAAAPAAAAAAATPVDPAAAAVEAAASLPLAPPQPLHLMADAAKLLAAMVTVSPGRVLLLLPQLPILSSPGGDLLAGLPQSVAMDALPAFTVPPCIDSFCGLLPVLSAVQRDLERPTGRYPLTVALLSLLAELLERGFVGAPLPVAALFVMYELLPSHHHWHYESLKERWTMTRGSFRVLRLALTAGAYVSDPDLSTSVVPLPPPKLSCTAPARGAVGTASATLLLTYGGDGGGGGSGGGGGGGGLFSTEEKGATVTPDDILQAAAPQLHVSLLSAAVLKLLLLHGPMLLARCLPPPADVLEQLQREDPGRPELSVLEECAAELVRIIPPLLAAAGMHPQEQPFEEYLFGGRDPTPAAHLVSYITYAEANQDILPPQQQVSYFAMRALLSIAACVARPVSRSQPGISLALAVPVGSGAESCLCSLLRGTAASEHPELYAVATQLATEAVANHPEVLDALLFPASLEHQQKGPGVGLPLLPAPPSAAGGAATGQGAARQWAGRALDGLYATLQNAGKLKQEQPQVLACALHVLAAMWRQPTAASRPVSLLRSTSGLWRGLEAILGQVGSDTSPASPALLSEAAPGADLEARAQVALCEAYALQILTAEAFARARLPAAAGAAVANGSEAQAVLDRLVRGGGLLRLLRAAAEPVAAAAAAGSDDVDNDNAVEPEIRAVGSLQHLAAALELSLGSALWNTGVSAGADDVSIGPAIREELSGVRSLMDQGMVSKEDLQSACSHLWMGPQSPAMATDALDDVSMPQAWHTNPLRLVLQRQCVGAALINRCHVSTTDLSQLPGSPTGPVLGTEQLLSRSRLTALLPSDYQNIMEPAVGEVNTIYSLGEVLIARLQAVCALTSVLAQGGRLLPDGDATATAAAALLNPPVPAGSSVANEPATPSAAAPSTSTAAAPAAAAGGLLTTVQLVCWNAVSGLVAWCASKDSRAALQSDWGLRRLHAQRVAAALTAARLLLSVMQSVQKALAAASPATTSGGSGGGGGFSTPARGPGPALNSIFATSIALTPVGAAPPRSGRHGATGASTPTISGGGGGGISADQAYLPFVASLARQWAVWARAVTGRLPQCPSAVAGQISDAIAGALLLALRPLQPESAVLFDQQLMQASDRQVLAASLRSTIPQLCDLAASGFISTSLAAQLLLETTRHLAIKDWLPQLFNKLDLGEYIRAAANRAADLATAVAASGGAANAGTRGGTDAAAAAGDLGMLSLAVAVAQVPEGAYMLYEQDIVENLVAASRQLLSGSGGRLAAFSVIAVTGTGPYKPGVDGTYASTAGAAAAGSGRLSGSPPPDTCGAYLPMPSPAAAATAVAAAAAEGKGEVWSPVHRQWCTLLQFCGSLVKTLGQRLNIERGALDLLMAMEPRLMLAVLPPGSDVRQPLTLAGLVEMEAVLFLLIQMTPYAGGWHMLLPSSLLNFRTAVSTLLTWLAQPNLVKSFSVDCRPRTAREAGLAGVPAAGVPCSDGWFRICTLGAASCTTAATGPAGSVATMGGAGGLGSPIFGSIPSVGSLSRGLSDALPVTTHGLVTPIGATRAASGLGLATPGGPSAGATPGASGGSGVGGMGAVCSEYSAQLAEKLYTCAQHALTFLVASSPQLSQGEAAALGPAWPRPQDLSALLDQCMCASESLAGVAAATMDTPGAHDRRTRLMHLLGRVGHLCSDFLSVLAAAGSSNAFGAVAGVAVREQLAREWLASLQAGPLGASAGGFGAGVGMHAVPAT